MDNSLVVALEETGTVLHEQMEKQSQNPLQAVMERLTPVQRTAIRNALIGALIGGGGAGGLAAAAKKPVGRSALAGALLGALAGGGGTMGLGMLTGQERLPGEPTSPGSLIGRGAEALVGAPLRHPLTTIGGIAGGIGALKTTPTVNKLFRAVQAVKGTDLGGPAAETALTKMKGILAEPSMLQRLRRVWPAVGKGLREAPAPGRIARLLTAMKPGTRIGRMLKVLPKGLKGVGGRGGLALLPVGVGLGYLLDKYIKGEY